MLFGKAAGGSGEQKPNIVVMAVLVVVILVAGFMVVRSMMGPGGVSAPADTSGASPTPPMSPAPGGPPGAAGQPAPAVPGQPGAQPPPPAPSPTGPAAPPAAPPVQRPTTVAESPATKPAPSRGTAAQPGMRQIKVFDTVSISYPASWKITAGGGNICAVFTDGKALFEVHPPDPKATSAKAIAESALKTLARGATVAARGSDKMRGYDTYWIAVTIGGATARIVGVDGPTRVVLFEHVNGAPFSAYRGIFNKMQAGIAFGG